MISRAAGIIVLAALVLGAAPPRASGAVECASPAELRRSFPGDFFRCPDCSVLLIDLDGLRPDRLGYARSGTPVTPFLDSLARRGVVFSNAAAQSNWTYPSAASVVTSQYPAVHRTLSTSDIFNPALPTIFSAFAARGYRIYGNNQRPFTASKVMFMDVDRFSFNEPAYVAEISAELDRISSSTSAPIMSYIVNMDMHAPYWRQGPVRADNWWGPAPDVVAASLGLSTEAVKPMMDLSRGYYAGVSSTVVSALNSAYDARASYVDSRLRDLFSRLSGAGLRDRTIVFLFANHGEGLLEHSYLGHGYNYMDEEVRVPLILLHPKIDERNSAVVCPQVELIDVAPTALEMTGAAAARFGAGRSLVPLMEGLASGQDFKYAFSDGASLTQRKMARSREWKLISMADGSYLLYDLARDPHETRDVKTRNPKMFKTLKLVLEAWENSTGRPYPPRAYPPSEADKAMLINNGYWRAK